MEFGRPSQPGSEPLTGIRLVDATGALVRAPEVFFDASEIGLEAFGYNIPNAALTAVLEKAAQERLTRIVSAGVTGFDFIGRCARLSTIEGKSFTAQLIAAADGRASPTRSAAGIKVSRWSYEQAAVVTTFAHSRPHHGISTELHRQNGPLTVVPSPGNTSSLVWVETPGEAARLLAIDDSDFARALGAHLNGLLGGLSAFTPRQSFPLAGQTAATLGKNRVALVGEAGHMMPPIGAQGLNLSFRDAASLAELAGEAKCACEDIGADPLLARYERLRRRDVALRVLGVDFLNRSLLFSWMPGVHLARGLGLVALAKSPDLRARVMREGVVPATSSPSLMQPVPGAGDIRGRPLDGRAVSRA